MAVIPCPRLSWVSIRGEIRVGKVLLCYRLYRKADSSTERWHLRPLQTHLNVKMNKEVVVRHRFDEGNSLHVRLHAFLIIILVTFGHTLNTPPGFEEDLISTTENASSLEI
jgi:hypothetical protein